MPRNLAVTGLLLALVGSCSPTIDVVVVNGPERGPATVVFLLPDPIPQSPPDLRVYSLAKREDLNERLNKLAGAIWKSSGPPEALDPGSIIEKCEPGVCRRDEQNGALELYPDFDALRGKSRDDSKMSLSLPLPPPPPIKELRGALSETVDVLKDDGISEVMIDRARLLKYARHDASRGGTPSITSRPVVAPGEAAIMYVSAHRVVRDMPVYGPGSRLFIASGARSAGMLFDWKKATEGAVVAPLRSEAGVKAEIERQLLALGTNATVYVQEVRLAYYDGGNDLLQPVYRFIAEFGQTARSVGAAQRVVGYVPFAETKEPIPSVDSDVGLTRIKSSAPAVLRASTKQSGAVNVELGRYVVREDRTGWHTDAEQFWDEASRSGGAYQFIDKQYFFAGPWQFETEKDRYVNSVDIALVEAHGFPWGFTTRGDRGDLVDFRKKEIAGNGYGARGDGKLKHLILHSCDAVPAPPDQHFWAYPWLDVFKGLHSVVGYRTAMYIDDGAGAAFARSLQSGAPVVPAWFNAVASLAIYGTDQDATSHCGGSEPLGRASAVVACGSLMASAVATNPAPSDCLEAWWMDDATIE